MEETRLTMKATTARVTLTLILLLLTLCGLAAYGLWLVASPLPLAETRAWAIVSTLALALLVPGAALAGFLFGRREASVLADGLRAGVNEVTRAADEVTTFKDKAAARSRQPPVTVQVAAGALPQPQMFHRQVQSGEEVVDL